MTQLRSEGLTTSDAVRAVLAASHSELGLPPDADPVAQHLGAAALELDGPTARRLVGHHLSTRRRHRHLGDRAASRTRRPWRPLVAAAARHRRGAPALPCGHGVARQPPRSPSTRRPGGEPPRRRPGLRAGRTARAPPRRPGRRAHDRGDHRDPTRCPDTPRDARRGRRPPPASVDRPPRHHPRACRPHPLRPLPHRHDAARPRPRMAPSPRPHPRRTHRLADRSPRQHHLARRRTRRDPTRRYSPTPPQRPRAATR